MINCVYCGSGNVYFSKKRQAYVCEDCERVFTLEEKSFVPKKVFLSYGHDENAWLVELICKKLKERGHHPWIDSAEIKSGNDWRERITQGILESNGFLSFLSNYSVRVPGVCLDEISIGVGNYNCRIYSILLEKGVVPPSSISNIQWLDMSDWKEKKSDPDISVFNAWFEEKMAVIFELLEDEKSAALSGNIDLIRKKLDPLSNSLKMRLLLQREIIPRKWLIRRVEETRQEKALAVFGSPGTGKSVLSAYLYHFQSEFIAAYFFEWNNSATRNTRNLITGLIFQIACSLEDYRSLLVELVSQTDPSALSDDEMIDRLLLDPLNMLIDGGRERKRIIFDAVDEAVTANPELLDLMLRITEKLPDFIRVVFTARPEAPIVEALQQYPCIVIDDHRDEIRRDIREFVSSRTADPDIAEKIIEKSDGSFIYAREMIQLLSTADFDPDRLPRGVSGAYFTNFRRVFPDMDSYRSAYKPLFEIILAAQKQLDKKEVALILEASPDDLDLLLRKIRSYVFEMPLEGNTVLQIFHKSFLEWLTSESAGIYRVSTQEGDLLFRNYILRVAQSDREPSKYLTVFAPSHYSKVDWALIDPAKKKKILEKLLYGTFLYGELELEKRYLDEYRDEIGIGYDYYMNALSYYRKKSGGELIRIAEEALDYADRYCENEQQAFDLVFQAAYSFFYAGLAERSYALITSERDKHEKEFWEAGINEANYWHAVALSAHDLDDNRKVVEAAGYDVKQYKMKKSHYELIVSMVNLFDGYMALGDLDTAFQTSDKVFDILDGRYYLHADDIIHLCHANLLQTGGRIMESLVYYETGLKLARQIHDWDYLYGSTWRELAIARFGDRSCFAALEKCRISALENNYRYLASLADCFQVLSAYLLKDTERVCDREIWERLEKADYPGHLLQAYCCRALFGAEKPDPDRLISLLDRCSGVKGEPTVVLRFLETFADAFTPEQEVLIGEWCDSYVSGIISYRDSFEKKLMKGLTETPVLQPCSCVGCGSKCCYDGVYVTPEEETAVKKFVEEHPDRFPDLPKPFIVNGTWPGMRSSRKTEALPYDGYDESFPQHFSKTRCVFVLPSGECSLQKAATDLQLHPWKVKPAACWSFPIRGVRNGVIQCPVTDLDEDPDYIDEAYPGYVSFLPCVKNGDGEGISWTEKYKHEIEYIRFLKKDFH